MIFDFKTLTISSHKDNFSLSAWLSLCGSKNPLLYIIMAQNASESFIKVGRTCSSINKRFQLFPYKYELLYAEYDSPRKIYKKEASLHRILKESGYQYFPLIPFSGSTECYSMDAIFFLSEHLGFQYIEERNKKSP